MNRRELIKLVLLGTGILNFKASGFVGQKNLEYFFKDLTSEEIERLLIRIAENEEWNKLPIGESVCKTGRILMGTPYSGGTLDTGDVEKCVINWAGLDCVTFFENCLCFARVMNKGIKEFSLLDEVVFTRYRRGVIGDYTSRLHYTSDWIYDNVRKGVVEDITQKIGGRRFPVNVSFMSRNPQYYPQLKKNPGFISKMKSIEDSINARDYYYLPKAEIEQHEGQLKNGDIIAITTNKKGLDYSHTGMVCIDDDNQPHFLHASSKQKKVVIDTVLSKYVNSVASDTGITVLRPLPPVIIKK